MRNRILTLGILFLFVFSTIIPMSLGYNLKILDIKEQPPLFSSRSKTLYVAETEVEKENFMSEIIVFSQPIFSEKEDYVSMELAEATSSSWEKGKPTLPVVTKVYTFPFGTRVDNVEVTFSDVIEQKVSKPIMPSPEIYPLSIYAINKVKEPETVMTYSDIDVYPEYRFGYRTGAGLKDGEHVIYLSVSLYPVQYKPKENTIYYSKSATIDVTYIPPEKPVTFPDLYDLLILTPVEFESALQPLVDHKNSLDPPVKTIMKNLDEIPSVGVDEQESIKYYIRDAAENWGITYVLLVGAGVEGQELFPVRYAWIQSPPFPSDLYYADIYNSTGGFPNWDKDGDGKYAEYKIDKPNMDVLPDVYLGKLPCNDVSEVTTIVDKIINYKAHNKMTKKILQAGGDSIPGDMEGIFEGEYANEKVLEKLPGYSTTQLWGSNGKLTKDNIAKGFKSNVDFVDFHGHGHYASWATHPPNDHTIWIPPKTIISPVDGWFYFDFDLFMVTNAKKLPVVVYTACDNNKYTMSPNCLGWKTVSKNNGGGIASFALTGPGMGVGGTDIVERFIGWMGVKVFEELYNTKVLGQVWANCVSDYYNTFETLLMRWDYLIMLEWSMFGDPTLVIEDGDDPKNRATTDFFLLGFLERFPILRHLLRL